MQKNTKFLEHSNIEYQNDKINIFYRLPFMHSDDNGGSSKRTSVGVYSLQMFPSLLYTDDYTILDNPETQQLYNQVITKILTSATMIGPRMVSRFDPIEIYSTARSILISRMSVESSNFDVAKMEYSYDVHSLMGNVDMPALIRNIPPAVDAMFGGTLWVPGLTNMSKITSITGQYVTNLATSLTEAVQTQAAKGGETEAVSPATFVFTTPPNKHAQALLNFRTAYSAQAVFGYRGNVFPVIHVRIVKYAYKSAIEEIYPMYEWFRLRFQPVLPAAPIPQLLIYGKDLNHKLLNLGLINKTVDYKGEEDILLYHVALPQTITLKLSDYAYSDKYSIENNTLQYDAGHPDAFYRKLTIDMTLTLTTPYLLHQHGIFDQILDWISGFIGKNKDSVSTQQYNPRREKEDFSTTKRDNVQT